MLGYFIRRLLWSIPVLLALLLAVFLLMHSIPGGPFDFAGDKSLPAATVRISSASMGSTSHWASNS